LRPGTYGDGRVGTSLKCGNVVLRHVEPGGVRVTLSPGCPAWESTLDGTEAGKQLLRKGALGS
jgi:hypothetical protein